MIIHPELTAIVARLEVALAHPRSRVSADMQRPLRACITCLWRAGALDEVKRLALYLPGDVADAPDKSMLWGSEHPHPAVAAMQRYVLHGTDYADLCSNGLTEFSMYLMSTEVA